MSAGLTAKGFNLGVIVISFLRGFWRHDEMDRPDVT
jgi:hypothetical protein